MALEMLPHDTTHCSSQNKYPLFVIDVGGESEFRLPNSDSLGGIRMELWTYFYCGVNVHARKQASTHVHIATDCSNHNCCSAATDNAVSVLL